MGLLDVIELSHAFGDNVLYKNATFELYKGEHMGIVGQNGTGKSTLLNTIIGTVIPDAGRICWQRNVKYGYLDQYAVIDKNVTIFDYLKTAFSNLYDCETELVNVYDRLAEENSDELINKASTLQDFLDNNGFYDIETTVLKVASGLGVTALGMDSILCELSGGQRAKVILAKLLLMKPDILLLDEPTNFLDKEHIEWLTQYLINFEGAFIVISHDFEFLDKVTNCICDIEFSFITKYNGNFTKFLQQKDLKKEGYIREFETQKKQIEKLEDYISRNKARASTANLAKSRQRKLDKIDVIDAPKTLPRPNFHFTSMPISAQKTLEVNDMKIGYDSPILPKMNFDIASGEKVVITGFNGIGKSTLIKTLIKQIPSLEGEFKFADNIKIGYYEQDLKWENPIKTPIQIVSEKYPRYSESQVRKYLAQCGVLAKNVMQPISSLSGGEQSKVKICLLMLTKCNLLILDEPTNHLDVAAKDVFREELIKWQGNIILVSHEQSFYRDWADQVINIGN